MASGDTHTHTHTNWLHRLFEKGSETGEGGISAAVGPSGTRGSMLFQIERCRVEGSSSRDWQLTSKNRPYIAAIFKQTLGYEVITWTLIRTSCRFVTTSGGEG